MSRDEQFEQLRPMLSAIAYRILGTVSEAEDAVQETWLRFQLTPTEPASTKAYLAAVVTRVCVDELRSARARRQTYVGHWFPEPVAAESYDDPERAAELADSLSLASLLLLERLSPLQRAVFVLRELFGFDYAEIAAAVHRTPETCRQLAARARRHMRAGRPRFDTDRVTQQRLAARSSTPSPPASPSSCTSPAARPRCGAPASSAPTTWPGCLPPWSRRSSASVGRWNRSR